MILYFKKDLNDLEVTKDPYVFGLYTIMFWDESSFVYVVPLLRIKEIYVFFLASDRFKLIAELMYKKRLGSQGHPALMWKNVQFKLCIICLRIYSEGH